MEATKIQQPPLVRLKGNDLILERELHGISQAELASRMRRLGAVDVYQQKIARWESEKEFCIDEGTFDIMIAAFQ